MDANSSGSSRCRCSSPSFLDHQVSLPSPLGQNWIESNPRSSGSIPLEGSQFTKNIGEERTISIHQTTKMIPEFIYIPADVSTLHVGYSFDDESSGTGTSSPRSSIESKRWQATDTSTWHAGASVLKDDCSQCHHKVKCDRTVCPRQPERKDSVRSDLGIASTLPPKMPLRKGTFTNLHVADDEGDDKDKKDAKTKASNSYSYNSLNMSQGSNLCASSGIQPNVAILCGIEPIRLATSPVRSLDIQSSSNHSKKQDHFLTCSRTSPKASPSSSISRIVPSPQLELR